ncbi:MAG: DUF2911 domain-containing protein [Sphingobacteriales bacterium]|nr:MAG: DUF2911 domain-containing protein [Sphingobacteriales bacterium]
MRYLFLIISTAMVACNNHQHNKQAAENTHAQHKTIAGNRSGYADSVNEGLIVTDTMKTSPRRVAMANIGNCHVHVNYGSPGVKGRNIWGGLVAYNQVWAAGAHKATTIEFSTDILLGNKKIAAGKYGLFMLPGEKEWTVIINTQYDQHLADDYDPAKDVARFIATPIILNKVVERLTYTVEAGDKKGTLVFAWEKIKITAPLSL